MHPSPSDLGFPRAARLLVPADYRRPQSGRSVDAGALVFKYAATVPPGQRGRLGLSVSRKVGSAVVRNRIKRVVRESFRLHQTVLSGWDVVVIARSAAVDLGRPQADALFGTLVSVLRGGPAPPSQPRHRTGPKPARRA